MDNPELGQLIVKQYDTDPASFHMATWAQLTGHGTVACPGGWAMLLSGYEIRREHFTGPVSYPSMDTGMTVTGTVDADLICFYRPDGTQVPPGHEWKEAYDLLGLDETEFRPHGGMALFSAGQEASHAIRRLRDLVEAAGEGN